MLHLVRDILQEEDALLVLVVHLPDEGAAVLVPPVGPEAVFVVAESVIPSGTDGSNFRENGSQNLAGSEELKKCICMNLRERRVCTKNTQRRTVSALLS